jgi:NTE family protein
MSGRASSTAFVLGGGGVLGAAEVGQLRALLEAGIEPDLILGTSVGALNGAIAAAHPGPGLVDRLVGLWESAAAGKQVYGDSAVRQVSRAVRSGGTRLYSSAPLRRRLQEELGDLTFEELPVRFQCCAASIERAAEHWFTSGRLVDAVVASAAVPGLLGPAVVDGEHYLDGGIVNSIPLGRAVTCGARRVFVLHVGRIERPLSPPRRPWEVARVSFEIARRHRFHRELAELPEGVVAHVLPTGGGSAKDDSLLAYRSFGAVRSRIDTAYEASRGYLEEHL